MLRWGGVGWGRARCYRREAFRKCCESKTHYVSDGLCQMLPGFCQEAQAFANFCTSLWNRIRVNLSKASGVTNAEMPHWYHCWCSLEVVQKMWQWRYELHHNVAKKTVKMLKSESWKPRPKRKLENTNSKLCPNLHFAIAKKENCKNSLRKWPRFRANFIQFNFETSNWPLWRNTNLLEKKKQKHLWHAASYIYNIYSTYIQNIVVNIQQLLRCLSVAKWHWELQTPGHILAKVVETHGKVFLNCFACEKMMTVLQLHKYHTTFAGGCQWYCDNQFVLSNSLFLDSLATSSRLGLGGCQDAIQKEENGEPFAQIIHQHPARRAPICK